MGLVDYSDSESDSETPQTSAPAPPTASTTTTSKKSFPKLVEKTNPGKILVNLPAAAPENEDLSNSEPAAKRVKTGGGRFSGFSSFLPPPKATTKPTAGTNGGKAVPKVGINLKTSSEAAFDRNASATPVDEYVGGSVESQRMALGLNLPPVENAVPKPAQPSIPEGQKPEEEVHLVGKPLMFKPLSVARNPTKRANAGKASVAAKPAISQPSSSTVPIAEPSRAPAPVRKIGSLFSVADDEAVIENSDVANESASYEPEFTHYDNQTAYADAQQQYPQYYDQTEPPSYRNNDTDPNSLDAIADDLHLDPVARRELFGRGGAASRSTTAKSVINFNLDQEYRHNEELRASGALDQQQHNPLRAIKPGKHSLQQLVNAVQTQRDALEENFAKNRSTQKQAGSKYGFR